MVQEPLTTDGQDTCRHVACRLCGQVGLNPILSLGMTPLANALLREDQLTDRERTWPLDLAWCPECSLTQITETVPAEMLFREYAYLSSFSDTMVQHARSIADRIREVRNLGTDSLVIEVASNDGYLLQWYHKEGIPVLGIEPARNAARTAIAKRGVNTISEFFSAQLAKRLAMSGQQADVIHANNVLAHVADLNGVVAGFSSILKPNGVVVVEVPYLKDLFDQIEFDTIYHEHLCYFSLTALKRLFQRHRLSIVDVERLQIHGGSLRIFAVHAGTAPVQASVERILRQESTWVRDGAYYKSFESKVESLRRQLIDLLQTIKADGKRIAVYGASAKGSTLLNYFGIGRDVLDFVVDRSTVKQGRYTPGTRLEISDPSRLIDEQPDYCLLLTWNFVDEILSQQAQYRQRGGKFIVPIPEVRVA